ncbi:NACHT domain-containing protein [Kribbella sp. NBC_00889]|uniref:NACHT domain-containing protein n=1 Tax=Kribbella sp. NBC_00889 TaxID=2975974 RepID=UPI0038679E7C|nr:NACHT domain-containing protein [Kribbella sp. NBC_00889]
MRIRDGMLRAVVLVVTVSLTLVLLPIAINVGTGGTAPGFLAPYADWTWPVIGALWLVAIVTALFEFRSRRLPTVSGRSADQPRNRPNALARVDRYLSQRVAGSLASRTRIALALEERPEAVIRPYDLLVQPLDSSPRPVSDDTDIATVFDQLQDSMLILGAPGAGKTTLLLELARALAEQAHADESKPIPVLIDLAGWTAQPSRKDDDEPQDSPLLAGFVRWLLGELNTRYGIPAAVGRIWLRRGRLALLLDGLDEIAKPSRAKLAPVLEELRRRYLIGRLAITCRTQDYELLPDQLSLHGAVHIRPLTRQQVLDYFAAVGPDLDGARAAIEQDDELWDLVNSPLMLNVMILAYHGRVPEEVVAGGVADLRRELFDTYISEVLARHRSTNRQYDSRTAVRSLWCLAWWTRSRAGDRTAVPRWLIPNGWYGLSLPEVDYLAHAVSLPAIFAGLVAGAILVTLAQYGVLAGLAVSGAALLLVHIKPHPWQALMTEGPKPQRAPLLALTLVLSTSCTVVLIVAVMGVVEFLPVWLALGVEAAAIAASYVVEQVVSHSNRRRLLLGVRLAVVVAAGWLTLGVGDRPDSFATGLAIGLLVAQGIRLVKSLPTDHVVQQPAGHGWWMDLWVLGGAVGGFLLAVALGADLTSPDLEAVAGVITGAVAAKAWRRRPPLFAGPLSRLLHDFLLRWTGYLPWRRRAFLRYAADRYVLARTGRGEYSFIHLLVRDHLAECSPNHLAEKVERRIAQRATAATR